MQNDTPLALKNTTIQIYTAWSNSSDSHLPGRSHLGHHGSPVLWNELLHAEIWHFILHLGKPVVENRGFS